MPHWKYYSILQEYKNIPGYSIWKIHQGGGVSDLLFVERHLILKQNNEHKTN